MMGVANLCFQIDVFVRKAILQRGNLTERKRVLELNAEHPLVRRLIETACASAPLLLVIEDLHYAGSEEAARLGELAASVASQPALLVLSTRPDEDPIDAGSAGVAM